MSTIKQLMSLLATDFHKAKSIAWENARNAPKSVDAWMFLAYIYNREADYENAINCLNKVIKLDTQNAQAYYNIAYIQYLHGNFKQAIKLFTQAIKNDRNNISCYCLLASSFHRMGDIDKAIKTYQNALLMKPDHPEVLIYLLFAYKAAARYDDARQTAMKLKAIFARDHNNQVAAHLTEKFQVNDSNLWEKLDNKKQLKQIVNQYREKHPDQLFSCYPQTFVYPDERSEFLSECEQNPDRLWILKPSSLYGGQHIKIIDTPASLPENGDWVVQRYIDNPLLAVGRKFGIRLYLLVDTTQSPRFYLYKNAGVRFAPSEYSKDKSNLTELSKHITQTELFRDQPDLIQKASNELGEETPVWLLSKLFQYLDDEGHDSELLRERLKNLTCDVTGLIRQSGILEQLSSSENQYAHQPKILGLDVQVDAYLNTYLLEIERYPGSAGRYKVDAKNGLLSHRILNRILVPFFSEKINFKNLSKADFQNHELAIQETISDEFDLI